MAKKKGNFTDKIRKNPWIISTIVLGLLVLVLIINGCTLTGKTVSENQAAEVIGDFVKSQTGVEVDVLETNKVSGLYEVVISYQGQEIPLYLTSDGENLVQGLTSLESVQQQEQQPVATLEYSETDLEKLREFNDCLGKKGVKVYGANWCGWTKKWVVETLGGFEVASSIYVECTEETELCSQEGVEGYPTTKINGELYTGERTVEAIAQVTSCPVPELEGSGASATSADASCE